MESDSLYNFSLSLNFELDQKWNVFYHISELMLATEIHKKIISFQGEINWKFTGCQVPHLMTDILCINLLNFSWRIKHLFLRNMEPLTWYPLLSRPMLLTIQRQYLCCSSSLFMSVIATVEFYFITVCSSLFLLCLRKAVLHNSGFSQVTSFTLF